MNPTPLCIHQQQHFCSSCSKLKLIVSHPKTQSLVVVWYSFLKQQVKPPEKIITAMEKRLLKRYPNYHGFRLDFYDNPTGVLRYSKHL